jgi:hypothetical protein
MGDGGGDIIIKGGSVDVNFDDNLYRKDPADPKRHENATRKITRITVVDESTKTVYDSGDDPSGLNWTVKVFTT